MKKIMSNLEIFNSLNGFQKIFEKEMELILPIKVSYMIQYNIQSLKEKYDLIEKSRETIGKKYGVLDENNGAYTIPPEKMEIVEVELLQLMKIEQTVDILMIDISELENCQLTLGQMKSLLFMINKPKEE